MRIRLRRILLPVFVPAFVALFALGALASIPPNLDEALNAQKSLAASNPADARILNDLGNLLVLTGQLVEAEAIYATAVGLAPDNAAIRYNHALALQQLRQSKPAIKEYKVVIELDPNQAWAHYQLGTLYAAGNRRERAVRHYARALELDPELLSPEVNPHIIENRLVTPSLILARWGDQSTAMVPRLYQQPARITDLLVPPLPAPEAAEEAAEDEETPAEEPSEPAGEGETQALSEGDLTSVHRPASPSPMREDMQFEERDLEGSDASEEEGDDEGEDEGEDAEDGSSEDQVDEESEEDLEAAGGGVSRTGAGSQVLTADDLVPSFVGQVQPRGRAPRAAPGATAGAPARPGVSPTTGPGGRPIRPPQVTDPGTTGTGTGTGTTSTGRLELLLLPDPVDRLAERTTAERSTG